VRLFVALTPPETVVAELSRAVADLRDAAPELRWTRPEQWHLTLAFLGEVAERPRAELERRLERAARRYAPLTLACVGGGRFSGRVLWTRVDGDRDALRRLAAATRAAAQRTGLDVEDRPYRPHLTLARSAGAADLRPLVERLAPFRGTAWLADTLHLMRSELGAGPNRTARYESVTSWPLSAPAAHT
jgi:2'-5' RNA ligase